MRLLLLLIAALAASTHAQSLTVLTHDSFDLSHELLERFTEETGVEVEILSAGDAGEALNRALLTRERPLADVLFGVDNSLLPRALDADLFEPYRSPLLDAVPEEYRLDAEHRVTPVDLGYVNFNLDRAYFEEAGLEPPQDLLSLTEPRYRGLTAVPDPATSSPGMAFLLLTIERFGEGWLDYWAALRDNGLLVTGGWTEAYYTAFSRYGGDRPVVLSYATSPAAEVIFAESELDEAPTANLLCEGCSVRQIETAGILRGSDEPQAARAFIDFLLSPEVQADIPASMFVYPIIPDVPLPEEFRRFAPPPAAGQALLAEAADAAQQALWLEQWSAVVLQGRDPEAVR